MGEANRMSRLGSDERNLARLVPVLGLNRVPQEMTGWHKSVVVDDLCTITVICSGNGQLAPHGIDGDVIFGLTTLYVLQGKPDDGYIVASVAELCSVMGIKTNGRVYERLLESITRLKHVSFEVLESWASRKKDGKISWKSLLFSVVNSIEKCDSDLDRSDVIGMFRPSTILRVGLGKELTDSIKAGHVRAIDLEFYSKLEQPLSRLLYRTLEEIKYANDISTKYSVPVEVWGQHLGMRSIVRDINGDVETKKIEGSKAVVPVTEIISPSRIRRSLDAAHAELISKCYLKQVDYVGRGHSQIIYYEFGTPQVPVDLELVALLTQRGMSPKMAEQHARNYGPKRVNRAAEVFDARKAAGYVVRNAGGLLTDILVDPEKYVSLDSAAPVKSDSVHSVRQVKPVIDVQLAEPTVEEKRKTNTFVVDGWAKRKWLVGQQHQNLLDLVKRGQLDHAKLASLGLADVVAVQKFVMEALASN
ncbi:replication initiator protein A [Deinococcus ruber]|uniref:Uncharacterized protein n=1 Tax=Deinococcus ruber TaxID=1848197 RepID=A0A918F6B5_9DEIO|nr:replication initiator protein A [Deinococcus ruber]GGR12704.1 hypothetical protein GCM10008957_27030 [Deinococcus ruber]